MGGERRPVPADSTAGVSLSGLTETAGMGSQALLQSQLDSIIGSDVTREESVAIGRSITGEGETPSESLCHPIDVVNLTPPNMVIERFTIDRNEAAIATGQLIENSNSISVPAMVFHFIDHSHCLIIFTSSEFLLLENSRDTLRQQKQRLK